MCAATQKPISFQFKPIEKATTVGNTSEVMISSFDASSYNEIQAKEGRDSGYPRLEEHGTINDLSKIKQRYFSVFNPPEISESIKSKLHISAEIEELLANDIYFRFTINTILNIIGDLIGNPGFQYRIDTNLRDKGNINGWERMDIIVKFPDENYDEITGYWKKISSKVSEFYKLLECDPAFSQSLADHMRKFVYIVVRVDE